MSQVTLYTGDCLDIMRTLEAGSVDAVITSPPYDNLRTYNGYRFDFEPTAHELFRVTKEGGVVVWIVADETRNGSETGTSFRQALYFKDVGFNLHDTMIWHKGSFTSPQKRRYPNTFEYMFVLSKGKPVCNQIVDRPNKKAGTRSTRTIRKANGYTKPMYADNRRTEIGTFGVRFNVWQLPPEQSNALRVHPAQFPVPLARDHILSWSNPGDTILDPFMGSGTTGVACVQTGRNFIGIEIDPGYAEIARARIEKAQLQARQEALPL